jgi:hypothetical protein
MDRAISTRMRALFDTYGIRPSPIAKERLLHTLAFGHVPGFLVPHTGGDLKKLSGKSSGPKMAFTRSELADFVAKVRHLSRYPNIGGVKKACNLIAKSGKRSTSGAAMTAAELERLYHRHRGKFVDINWSKCKANPSKPCVHEDMEFEDCLRGCRHKGTCGLFNDLGAARLQLEANLAAARIQLERVAALRRMQEWASPRLAEMQRGKTSRRLK